MENGLFHKKSLLSDYFSIKLREEMFKKKTGQTEGKLLLQKTAKGKISKILKAKTNDS